MEPCPGGTGFSRLSLIAEPFFVLENDVGKEDAQNGLESSITGLRCLGSVGLAIATVVTFLVGEIAWGFVCLFAAVVLG